MFALLANEMLWANLVNRINLLPFEVAGVLGTAGFVLTTETKPSTLLI